ncbi:MAG: hypothetical protein J6D03_07010 [Clostridia bacterium]|nr:hypothetical protein [Clostridia bacterium]
MSLKLLKDLNFAEKLNSTEAVTEAGKECLKSYRGYMYTNAPTCGIVNGFIQEARRFSFDTGMMSILESVLSFVNENKISWKLASACESVQNNNSTYGYIAKLGVDQVQKLLEMNESEVVSYIKSGALKNVQYIPEFRSVCKDVYKTTINEVHSNTFAASSPISFVKIEESNQYFKIYDKTFKINESGVSVENDMHDANFDYINSLLQSFRMVGESLVYEYKANYAADTCKYTIDESEIKFEKGSSINETFKNSADFKVYCDNLSHMMPMNERMQFMNISNAVAVVYENANAIVRVEEAKVVTCSDGTVYAIVEGKNNVNMTVFRSQQYGMSSKNYDFMIEALKDAEKISNVDLKALYESRIVEDCKRQKPEDIKNIEEELKATQDAMDEIRRKKIEQLAESFKNDASKIAILNSLARELALLESK